MFFIYTESTSLVYFSQVQARELLGKMGDLSQTQIFAKIESEEVS